jgi:Cyclic nucleotide-binding domain/Major Facilitator Superfamily
MRAGYWRQVAVVLAALRSNRDLRRVQFAFAGFTAGEWAVWIATLVYAYDHGGATAAGLVALAQLAPATVFGPYAGALGDRHPRGTVLFWGYVGQGGGFAAMALAVLAGAPPVVVYACAIWATLAVTITRPTQSALLPALARTPEELTASNVVAGWVEGITVLLAPAAAGVVLMVAGPGAVFAVFAGVIALSALATRPLIGRPAVDARPDDAVAGDSLAAGLATLKAEPAARLLVLLLAAQFVAIGALDVLYVVLAKDTLALGDAWAGYLNAAFGAGGALGIAATVTLIGRPRLMPALVLGIVAWAVSLAVLAAVPRAGTALLLLGTAGLARMLADVAGRTLLQRAAPPEVLARVFGVLEGLQDAALAAGSLLAPALVAAGGASLALIGTAAVLPLVALVAFRRLRHIDQKARIPVVELSLLRAMPIFAGLPAPALEGLAGSLNPRAVGVGEVLIRQGEIGEEFFAIAGGELDVDVDGLVVRTVSRGDGVGEIALVRDCPRTASVVARTEAHVFSLAKGPFLAAVSGHAPVHVLVEERLVESARARVPVEEAT